MAWTKDVRVRPSGWELKLTRLETLFDCAYGSGAVPGTLLSRALLPEDQGGGIGWCLSIGRMNMPKCHFYSRSINGCIARARNAVKKGKTAPPEDRPIGLKG